MREYLEMDFSLAATFFMSFDARAACHMLSNEQKKNIVNGKWNYLCRFVSERWSHAFNRFSFLNRPPQQLKRQINQSDRNIVWWL